MTQELLLREMLAEMRKCINKEDVKAGLPFEENRTYDIDHIFVLWQQFQMRIQNLKRYIEGLDYDIAARVPWGDVTHPTDEGFTEGRPITRYWTVPKQFLESSLPKWQEEYNATVVSEGDFLVYLFTSTPRDVIPQMAGAEEATVCPSPASTLIMLQTRAKDKLKLELLKQTDFAVAHYLEVEDALGLKDTIIVSKRKRLLHRIKKVFRK